MTDPVVRMSGVAHRFGAVTALDGADLTLYAGEVHGVLGENGAGKSTLLSVLAGAIRPDSGVLEVGGVVVAPRTPRDAWALGIGLVHQHFKLVPALSVLDNLALGHREGFWGGRIPYDRIRRAVAALVDRTALEVDLERTVSELSVAALQRVEILKALLRDPRVLVLDEPTAVLAPREVDALFELLRSLASEGRAIAVVAHKLDEVLGVADRVTVLRAGRSVATGPRKEWDARRLAQAMVGTGGVTESPKIAPRPKDGSEAGARSQREPPGEVVAVLDGVGVREGGPSAFGDAGLVRAPNHERWTLRAASLEVRRGEIVGIAGVEGNGQRELALVLAGRLQPDEGRAHLPSRTGFVPENRTTEGLIGAFDLTENVALAHHRSVPGEEGSDRGDERGGGLWNRKARRFAGRVTMPWRGLRARTEEIVARFDVQAPGLGTAVGHLSGGNQQRLIVGRELEVAADLLVAQNPSRGLDFRATAFVREQLLLLASRGADAPGVVLVSSDLDELLHLADRISVMVRGRLRALPPEKRSREAIGAAMLGAEG